MNVTARAPRKLLAGGTLAVAALALGIDAMPSQGSRSAGDLGGDVMISVAESKPLPTTPGRNGGGSGNNGNGNGDNKRFAISGTVSGLYPSISGKKLRLQLDNGSGQEVTVTSLTVTAAASPTGCSGSNLLFGLPPTSGAGSKTFTPNVLLPRKGTAFYEVDVTMAQSAGNACANTHFPLSYQGTAEQS